MFKPVFTAGMKQGFWFLKLWTFKDLPVTPSKRNLQNLRVGLQLPENLKIKKPQNNPNHFFALFNTSKQKIVKK